MTDPTLSSPMKSAATITEKRTLRGIKNLSHTACHTSSSLQLLYHCFPALRFSLLDLSLLCAETKEEPNNELVYQLSHFFHLLTNGETVSKRLSPKGQVRKRIKQPLTSSQQSAVQDFMKRSEYGESSDEDWKRLVSAMRESNRNCYEDVLGQVLSRSFGNGDIGSEIGEAIDPTNFYEQLVNYTTSHESNNIIPIHPTHLADSATVFRSFLRALEFSTSRELERIRSQCEILEVERWNDEREGGSSYKRQCKLREALQRVCDAMQEEWDGTLVSRIVGTCIDVQESEDGVTTTTTIKLTKKNGGIKRPTPVPFALPVMKQNLHQPASGGGQEQSNCNEKHYYESLTASLNSVTIEPNPIRGYHWSEMIKRGEVTEEIFVRKVDADGNEVIEQPDQEACIQTEQSTEKTLHLDGLSLVHAQEKKKRIKDDASVASRSIGVQTDSSVREGDKILIPRGLVSDAGIACKSKEVKLDTGEVGSTKNQVETRTSNEVADDGIADELPPPPPPPKEVRTEPLNEAPTNNRGPHSVYALAVAAIAANTPKNRRRSRLFSSKTNLAKGNRGEVSPGTETLSGMEVGAASTSIQPSPIEVEIRPVSGAENHSVEESTVDSKVSSVASDGSSITHSSAIETPSDIDELSLGSFTESDDEASENEAPQIPLLDKEEGAEDSALVAISNKVETPEIAAAAVIADDMQTEKSTPAPSIEIIQSAGSMQTNISEIVDTHADSYSDSSSADSSSSSSSSSSYTTSSSDTSDSSESSSSDENISNNLSKSTSTDASKESANQVIQQEWVTRKETRFCHPLPKNLIFHLKRFEYSNVLGRVESVAAQLDIPEEIDMKCCCLDSNDKFVVGELESCCYRYYLVGAIAHVSPIENESDAVYGESTEGHYTTFVRTMKTSNAQWFEIDDDKVHKLDKETCNKDLSQSQLALKVLSGCDVYSSVDKEKERRYASMVVYSRVCYCAKKV